MSVAASFDWRCLSGSTMAPFPHPAHRTGQADFPHPALGHDFTPLPSRATPSAVSEHSSELIGCPISMSFTTYCVCLDRRHRKVGDRCRPDNPCASSPARLNAHRRSQRYRQLHTPLPGHQVREAGLYDPSNIAFLAKFEILVAGVNADRKPRKPIAGSTYGNSGPGIDINYGARTH